MPTFENYQDATQYLRFMEEAFKFKEAQRDYQAENKLRKYATEEWSKENTPQQRTDDPAMTGLPPGSIRKSQPGSGNPIFTNMQAEVNTKREQDKTQQDQAIAGEDNKLADFLFKVSRKAMEIDPKLGITYAKEAAAFRDKAIAGKEKYWKEQKDKMEIVADTYGTATDQESWDVARQKLAEYGIKVPERFAKWNEDTAKYTTGQAMMGSKAMTKFNYQLKVEDELRKKEADKEKAKQADYKNRQAEAKEALARENFEWKKAEAKAKREGVKPPVFKEWTIDQQAQYKKIFEGKPAFDDLDASAQADLLDDFHRRNHDLLVKGYSERAAKSMAEDEVLSNIKNGEYVPSKAGVEADILEREQKQTGGASGSWDPNKQAKETSYTKESPAQPTTQEAFDALKPGDWFINPADGRLLQKKAK